MYFVKHFITLFCLVCKCCTNKVIIIIIVGLFVIFWGGGVCAFGMCSVLISSFFLSVHIWAQHL